MSAYYNEIDPYAAQWLRNLIDAGHIARGDVDERSIADVRAADLAGYTQAHFFAGIGGWSLALRLAGWPDDRPVWTGSCPCQPFSAAGKGEAADDERHLWPAWFPLIAQRRPAIVFGEQVDDAIGWGWTDLVFADLEAEGYACGQTILPACSVGAPHIRDRIWFVAHADGGDASTEGLQRGGEQRQQPQDGRAVQLADAVCATGERGAGSLFGAETPERGPWRDDGHIPDRPTDGREAGDLAHSAGRGFRELGDAARPRRSGHADSSIVARDVGNAEHSGREGWQPERRGSGPALPSSAWDCDWLPCTDGKARPVRPGSFPLAHGVSGRMVVRRARIEAGAEISEEHRYSRTGALRGFGNAIVPQVAAEFIRAATH